MEDSILNSIKKLLGITQDYTNFDTDIIIHINSVFMVLTQMGVGPSNGFKIEDSTKTWKEYMITEENLEAVKSYIYLKVRLIFDPPINSAVIESIKQMITELEWRLNVQAETNNEEGDIVDRNPESIPDEYIGNLA